MERPDRILMKDNGAGPPPADVALDRHQPAAHFLMGCGVTAFTAVWTLAFGFIAILLGSDLPPAIQGSRASLALHYLALFQLPFFYAAVFLGWVAVAQFRQVRLRPAGLAVTRRLSDGWLAEIPSAVGFLLGVGVFQLALFLTAFTPLMLAGKRNPLWVWYLAGPGAVLLGVAAYRRWRHRPFVRIDDRHRTIALSRGRRKPPLVAPWDAVRAIEVACISLEDGRQYDVHIVVRIGDGAETVRYRGRGYPEPAERFASWLRERVRLGETPTDVTASVAVS